MSWEHHAARSYSRNTAHTQAFVFGCSRPSQLWAWVVVWSSGKAAGVEQGMHSAKIHAEDCARQVETRWPEPKTFDKQAARAEALSIFFGAMSKDNVK